MSLVSGVAASGPASARGAHRISPGKFFEKAGFSVSEQSERATQVASSAQEDYQESDRGSPVTEGEICSAVYMLDTADSAGRASDAQVFAAAPRHTAPRAFSDAGESRDFEEIAQNLLATQPKESMAH